MLIGAARTCLVHGDQLDVGGRTPALETVADQLRRGREVRRGDAVPEPARPSSDVIYLTLAAARALECNGCGDCCDSRRTDGYWTWPGVPADQYASLCGGQPLIIPLERIDSEWRDRAYRPGDEVALGGTRFRCAAFEPHVDGSGGCSRHDQPRPPVCGEFPVWGLEIEIELAAAGEASLNCGAFPRCTWFGILVVAEGDPRLE